MRKIVVIGGGASGLMGAIWAARSGASVTVLEQNEKIGHKLSATGNGKCNLTNTRQDPSCYRSSQPKVPWEIIRQFPLSDTLRFFSELGIYTKNKDGWMYPYCEQASSVSRVLEMEARHQNVQIKTRETVTDILRTKDGFQVLTQTWRYDCDRVLICCGGGASLVKGTSRTGYELAKKMGHHMIEPLPALTPLWGIGNYFGKWAGCRMEGVVRLEIEGTVWKEEAGELLFTDYGISGIAVFQLSRFAVRAAWEGCQVICHLDLMPDFTLPMLENYLEKRQQACPYKTKQELLYGLLPEKLIPIMAPKGAGISEIASNLKDWLVPVQKTTSMKRAQVCSGGVDLTELTPHLESRLQPGVYFAGEVVDVDGACGGYNLQWAWSSGAVAGQAAAKEELDDSSHTAKASAYA